MGESGWRERVDLQLGEQVVGRRAAAATRSREWKEREVMGGSGWRERVGLQLGEQVVGRRAAVDPKKTKRRAASVLLHRFQHLLRFL